MSEQMSPLETILSEVLANMAFMFGEPVTGDAPPEPDWLECVISYRGPQRGELKLRCPEAFADVLAANLLGMEPGSPELAARIEDTVKELLNVICGQTVTTYFGRQAAFDLTIPCMKRLEALPPALAPSPDAVELCVEGHMIQLIHTREGDADNVHHANNNAPACSVQ
jgi:CheY-specific phosphatase CheX